MACDYEAIRRDNERRYGTDIGRIGPMLLADRYDDRTHFIFELLQNAEDALARRPCGWQGSRSVHFELAKTGLCVRHYGEPFNEADVRGICGIAESKKGPTQIGRFGIGFKSVYAFTDRPEIHSGSEAFAIESFVWPVAVPQIQRDPEATVILIPLKDSDTSGHDDIVRGLRRLGSSALLFLRQINEIGWKVEDGRSGLFLRESNEITPGVRRVTVIGQESGKQEIHEHWLIFSRAVTTSGGLHAGHVEIAFRLKGNKSLRRERIVRIDRSPLVVFFPTVLETHLGFLVQGPYRTTPSRDNLPRDDAWNQHLVRETAKRLVEALRWLRDNHMLDTEALRCLPLDPTKFPEDSLLRTLFDAVKSALKSEPLLPSLGGGYVAAGSARLGRTQELRDLFTPVQLAALHGGGAEIVWLSGDITQDRTPDLRRYLMQELDVEELTPEAIIPKLDKTFLEQQTDDWIRKLYEFLNGQLALRWRVKDLPLIRLQDGTHVPPKRDGQPLAFLPGPTATGFPVVRRAACNSETALEFLRSLGLTEPDPVDDVVHNILPKYRDEVEVSDEEYANDIARILHAFGPDSKSRREKLLNALRQTAFVKAVKAGDSSKWFAQPDKVYLATQRLKKLFDGVPNVLMVDDSYDCLGGEDVRKLLEACGAVRYLRPVADDSLYDDWEKRRKLREQAGHPETSLRNDRIEDWMLSGLNELLEQFPNLEPERRRKKAKWLWEELAHLEESYGKGVFTGKYTWTHRGNYRTEFDAAFVRLLNDTAWIPDDKGELLRPEFVLFETLGWEPNPFLQSKIRFKPPVIEQLAKEVGIEPGALDLLKTLGITSEAELRARLGIKDDPTPGDSELAGSVQNALAALGIGAPTPAVPQPASGDAVTSGRAGGVTTQESTAGSGGDGKPRDRAEGQPGSGGHAECSWETGGKRTPGTAGGRPFVSYVAVHPDGEESDPDGLDQDTRMELEAKAIELILSRETEWRRTPTHNTGFDLFKVGTHGQPVQWCEVKAMTGGLKDRPIGLSRAQFDCAREHGEAYWLYIVEQAGTDRARIVRIQDPAGKARTFTFDHGWFDVAEVDAEEEDRED